MNFESWAGVYARAVLFREAMERKERGDEIGTQNAIEDNIP
jgi:hypothetical protein